MKSVMKSAMRMTVAVLMLLAMVTPAASQGEGVANPLVTSRSSESVIISDDFEDADTGALGTTSPEPGVLVFGYQAGYYVIEATSSDYAGELSSPVSGDLTDSTVAVDAALLTDNFDITGKYIALNCRQGAESGGYQLEFRPSEGTLSLWRNDATSIEQLDTFSFEDPATLIDSPHRMELGCNGGAIAGRLDGVELLFAFDETYSEGATSIAAGAYQEEPGPFFAFFDNLAVSTPGAAPVQSDEPVEIEPFGVMDFFALGRDDAISTDPELGPMHFTITQLDGTFPSAGNNLNLLNFYADFSFTTPATEGQLWDAGVVFRTNEDGELRLIIRSDNTWHITFGANRSYTTGMLARLDASPGAINRVELVVQDGAATLVVNDEFGANFDVSVWQEPGDIYFSSGIFDEFSVDGQNVEFSEVSVWDLAGTEIAEGEVAEEEPAEEPAEEVVEEPAVEPVEEPVEDTTSALPAETVAQFEGVKAAAMANPPAAVLPETALTEATGTIAWLPAGVDVADFYTSANLTVPVGGPNPGALWDIVVGFRHVTGDDQHRFVVDSNGKWIFQYGINQPGATGTVGTLRTGEGESNQVEVAVSQGIAYFSVNGELVAAVEMPGGSASGDIWIASGVWEVAPQDGRVTTVSNFQVWTA